MRFDGSHDALMVLNDDYIPSLAGDAEAVGLAAGYAADAEKFWREQKIMAREAESAWRKVKRKIETLRGRED
jgi:hypothetical protein